MRASIVLLTLGCSAFVVTALASCSPSDVAMAPAIPPSAILDMYDAAVLDATSAQAPTFKEVAMPHDETSRRFRAWLGWTAMQCEPCPPDQAWTCAPRCTPGKPYVCERPSRTVACTQQEVVSTEVHNSDGDVPAPGPYVFEGAWAAPASGGDASFVVTRVARLEPPPPSDTQ